MGDANTDVVRAAFLAQNQADDEGFRAALHPDVEWYSGPNPFGFPETLHGHDEVVRVARETRERTGRLLITLHEVECEDDHVLVIGTLSSDGLTMPRAWIWTIRDGRAVRVRAFATYAAAVTAWEHRVA